MATLLYSYLNPIRFYNINPGISAQFNWKHMDDFEFTKTIPDFNEQIDYYQPWQTNNHIKVQFQADFGPHTFKILDASRKVISSFSPVQKQQNIQNPSLYIYELDIDLSTAVPGEGLYRLRWEMGGGPDIILESNQQDICTIHKHSLLFQYKHFQYHEGIVFETGFWPELRIEGAIPFKSPASKDSIFEDQVLNETVLYSRRYRVYELIIGDSFGSPAYLIDMMDAVLTCSEVQIDGRIYAKADGSSWSETSQENYDLKGWKRDMREALNKNSLTIVNGAIINKKAGFIITVDSKGFGNNQGGSTMNILDVT